MYTVLDFETTGLNPAIEQVTEIGVVKLDADLNEIGSMNLLVNLREGMKLSDRIIELTGITEDLLVHGLPEQKAMKMLKDFIGNDTVVAQFASFDLSYLAAVKKPKNFICTRTMSQLLNPHLKASLKDLVIRYDVKLENHHRAIADVRATIEIFKIMKADLDAKGVQYQNVMSEGHRKLNYVPKVAKVVYIN